MAHGQACESTFAVQCAVQCVVLCAVHCAVHCLWEKHV